MSVHGPSNAMRGALLATIGFALIGVATARAGTITITPLYDASVITPAAQAVIQSAIDFYQTNLQTPGANNLSVTIGFGQQATGGGDRDRGLWQL